MNRLAFKLSHGQHKKAIVTVVDKPSFHSKSEGYQKFPYCPHAKEELAEAKTKAYERRKKTSALNEQVKNDLGIEFTIKYWGFTQSAFDPEWYGDTWEVTGNGDFKLAYRTGTGHRICFWHHTNTADLHAFIVPPSAMVVLASIRLDNPGYKTFENWCNDLGFDPDSRRAEKVYNACVQQTMMFMRNYDINLDEYEPLNDY